MLALTRFAFEGHACMSFSRRCTERSSPVRFTIPRKRLPQLTTSASPRIRHDHGRRNTLHARQFGPASVQVRSAFFSYFSAHFSTQSQPENKELQVRPSLLAARSSLTDTPRPDGLHVRAARH